MAVTALLERAPARPTEIPGHHGWGVWCDVEQRFLITTERLKDAWIALLETTYPYPWELSLRGVHEEDQPILVTCDLCDGAGTCGHCDQTCPQCDGSGEVEGEP